MYSYVCEDAHRIQSPYIAGLLDRYMDSWTHATFQSLAGIAAAAILGVEESLS